VSRKNRLRSEWLPEAERNRESQLDYIERASPQAAIELGDRIEAAINRLEEFPDSGRAGRVAGSREQVILGTPFIIIYRIEPEAVVILRLLHGAQQYPPADADP
jgi:plasmid stabilization system protein ParE